MFWRILKKDLKRKKTMNIILLLFVILCSMFAAAAVNNIIAVTGGIEHYFDAADVPDVSVRMINSRENDLGEKIGELACVKEIRTEHWLCVSSSKYFRHNGKELDNFTNAAYLLSDSEMAVNYFDENNHIIESVDKGCFYASAPFLQDIDIKEGDEVELDVGNRHLTLKFMGRFKGALFSTENSNPPYLIMNSADYDYLSTDEAAHIMNCGQFCVNTSEVDEIRELVKNYGGAYVNTREESKSIYLYDMLSAYVLMIISIVLMFTAFVVLRFTIGFTVSEEFREIGVMKAVGIGNGSIRSLYIVKYLAIAVVGTLIGYFCSVPLGDMMLKTVSENIVLSSESGILMGLLSSAAVVILILLFCYGCTRRVNKLSPIDAVRNGQTGERFQKKSLLHLGRSKLPQAVFLSVNDVLSSPRQFSIMIVVFALCILLMTIMSNFALTLKSEKILRFFDVPSSEAHIMDSEILREVMVDQSTHKQTITDTEKLLADNGMPGKCTMTISEQLEASHGDKTAKIIFHAMKGETNDTLYVDKGSAPQKTDEIAVTVSTLDDLDAEIGDRVTAVINEKKYEFIITGTYSSFISHAAFLYEDFNLGHLPAHDVMGLQIHFDGSPDRAQINKNIEKLKSLFDTDKVYSTSDFIKNFTGMSDTLNAIKQMMMIITVIVTALIVILMERSFIFKEKSEIALMKAVGIDNGSIILQHSLRLVTVSVIACIVTSAVLMPISNVMMNWVGNMVGDISGLKCDFDPLEIFVICPAILIGTTVIGSFLTALYTKTIKASDTASIE
ncbi:ABC transporter permease [bacterium D16-51]|nr:ABC transporter permease [bacterium D16-59]RKI59410.1 ABC transporter permease [bacterium D16-51]